ncbi:MAG: aminotransferase class V-fold PLP-dependent enzyme [Phycisphaerae bacterium]|nr:aminotransferase class V-fold PLP-dependent enzyme [Phycisphaerae bacterium]
MNKRLYADNAATSFPKPPGVWEAMRSYAEQLGASAGRGAYHEAVETGELLTRCRRQLARLINAESPNQVIFTHNCSGALNQAIKGLLRSGDHVVTTTMEHNSVLRPLNSLTVDRDISVDYVQADSETGIVDLDAVIAAIRTKTRLVAVVHASNVTGSLQPIEAIGVETRRRGIPLLVDAAQSAGHVPIDVRAMGIDLLALPGHKGLMGPLGTGALYLRSSLENELSPLIEGGTGSASEHPIQPDFLPDKFESGSHNAIGIAGLSAALSWVETASIDRLHSHDQSLCAAFIESARGVDGLTVYGPMNPRHRVAVFSVRVEGFDAAELAAALESEFEILTRPGIHCAPLAHRTIGTDTEGGTTRLSFGVFNTVDDVHRCVDALSRLAAAETPA